MKNAARILASALLLTAPTLAQQAEGSLAKAHDLFDKVDRDDDNLVSALEAGRQRIPSADFVAYDADRDRKLSKSEFTLFYRQLLIKAGKDVESDLDAEAARIEAARRAKKASDADRAEKARKEALDAARAEQARKDHEEAEAAARAEKAREDKKAEDAARAEKARQEQQAEEAARRAKDAREKANEDTEAPPMPPVEADPVPTEGPTDPPTVDPTSDEARAAKARQDHEEAEAARRAEKARADMKALDAARAEQARKEKQAQDAARAEKARKDHEAAEAARRAKNAREKAAQEVATAKTPEQRAQAYVKRLEAGGRLSAAQARDFYSVLTAPAAGSGNAADVPTLRAALKRAKTRISGFVASGALTSEEARQLSSALDARAKAALPEKTADKNNAGKNGNAGPAGGRRDASSKSPQPKPVTGEIKRAKGAGNIKPIDAGKGKDAEKSAGPAARRRGGR